MERRDSFALLSLLLFVGYAATAGILFFILPQTSFSDVEKRFLAKAPSFSPETFWAGQYTDSLDFYVADNFPLREQLVGLAFQIKEWRGYKSDEIGFYDGTVNTDAGIQNLMEGDSLNDLNPDSLNQEAQLEVFNEGDAGDVGRLNKGLLIYEGMAVQVFGGGKGSAAHAAKIINSMTEYFNPDSVRLFFGVTPTHGEFYLPSKYGAVSESGNIALIYEQIQSPIKTLKVFEEQYPHRDDYLFFNTDHHWTGLGAYYAYVAFCKAAGFKALSLDEMERKMIKGPFLGSLYRLTKDKRLKERGDSVIYHKIPSPNRAYRLTGANYKQKIATVLYAENAQGGNSYGVFLGSDHPLMVIETEQNRGRKALLIKNSFGNALAPYLVPHFEQVYVLDYRYFKANLPDFVRKNGITDVIVFHNSFSANTFSHMNMLKSLLTTKQTAAAITPATNPSDSNALKTKTDSSKIKTSETKNDSSQIKKSDKAKPKPNTATEQN